MSPSLETRDCRVLASELKFRVNVDQAYRIHEWARTRLAPDPHAGGPEGDGYHITSLYFDTDDFAVFRRRGSYGRSKYRIRRYNDGEVAYMERKLKTGGLLAKRRSLSPLGELARLEVGGAAAGWAGYWFHRRLLARRLRPMCQIAYHRTARFADTPQGPIRLTLDRDLVAARPVGMTFNGWDEGRALLGDEQILELKFRQTMPSLFKALIAEFALEPGRFSKYRLAAVALGLVSENDASGEPVACVVSSQD